MKQELDVYYDEEGDFFEISIDEDTEEYVEEQNDGVFIIIEEETKKVRGIGILSFKGRKEKGELKVEYDGTEDSMQLYFSPQSNTKTNKIINVNNDLTFTYNNHDIQSVTLQNASKYLPKKMMEEAVAVS